MTDHQTEAERLAMWYCPICLHIMNECQSKHYAGCPTDKQGIMVMHLAQHTRLDLPALLAAKAELYSVKRAVDITLVSIDPIPPLNQPWQSALKRIERVNDQLRAELVEENKTVDNCWKALGIETYEQAKPLAISQHIEKLRTELSELKTKHENLAKYARETWDKYAATQADNARLTRENAGLALQLGTQTSIAAHLEHALTTPNETVLRCLENLNRNGSVSPQLAAEALAAMKGQ